MGAIGPIKGFDALLTLAAEIHARSAEAELAVIGYTRNDAASRAAGIRVTGPYRNEEAAEAIAREDSDLILIASTVPETYCYTLSHALASGRAVAAFDIGALGTRMRDAQALGAPATLLPLKLAREPGELLEALLALRQPGPQSASAGYAAAGRAAEKSGPVGPGASRRETPARSR